MSSLCHNRKLFFFTFLVVLFLFSFPCGLNFAADWSLSPGIRVSQEYNSDVLFSHLDSWEDFFTRVEPRFKLIGESERAKLELDSRVIGEKYYEYGHFDTVNTDNELTLDYAWSPRFSTTLTNTFIKDNILETELERAGVAGFRQDRYKYGFDLTGNYVISEVFSVALGGGGTFSYYPDGPYPDLDLWDIHFNPTWIINPRDSLGLYVNFDYADYEEISTIQTLSQTLYWRRDLSDTTFFVLGAGYRYTWTKYEFSIPQIAFDPTLGFVLVNVDREIRDEDDGFIFNFSLNNDWTERFTTIVDLGREHYNAIDARGIDRNYIRMTLKYKLTEKTSFNCKLAYDVTEEKGTYGVDRDYIKVSPSLRWRCTKDLVFDFHGSYEYRKTDGRDYDYDTDRFRSWVSLSYWWPRLWANH